MAAQAGSAYIPIRPDMRGFHTTIKEELQKVLGPLVDRIGREIGQRIGDGVGDGIGDPLEAPLEESTRRQRQRAPRDGDAIAGAFATGFEKRLKAALARLPKAEITADSSEAEAKVQTLRASLEELAGQRIGVDVDAATALTRLEEIRTELADLEHADNPIDIRLNAGEALAQLAAFQAEIDRVDSRHAEVDVDANTVTADTALAVTEAEVDRLDGRTANVDVNADTGAALAQIVTLHGALLSLGVASAPALLGIGAGVVGLAGPLAAAGAGFGGLAAVAIPALTRIKTAVDAQTKAQQSAGASAIQGQQQALAMAGAQQQLADAVRAQATAHTQALDQERTAQQQLTQAEQSAADAERALSAARHDAARAAQDLKNQVVDAGFAVQQDRFAVDDARTSWLAMTDAAKTAAGATAVARKQLADAQAAQQKVIGDPGSTDAAKTAAQAGVDTATAAVKAADAQQKAADLAAAKAKLAYQQAVQQLKEQQQQLQRLKADEAAAAKAGVDGSDAVRSAREKLAQANQQVENSERALAASRANVAATDRRSAEQVAAAHRGVASASLATAASNATLADSMAALTPMERQVAAAWQGLQSAFTGWAKALEPQVLPLFLKGISLIQGLLPLLTPLVQSAAAAMSEFLNQVGGAAKSPFWTQFISFLGDITGPAIKGFGSVFLSLAKAAAGLVEAFAPIGFVFLEVLGQVANRFAVFATGLASNPAFKQFIRQMADLAPVLLDTFVQLGGLLGTLFLALAPLMKPALSLIDAIAKALGGALKAAAPAITSVVSALGTALIPVVTALGPILSGIVTALAPLLVGLIGYLKPVLLALAPLLGVFIKAIAGILLAIAPLLPSLGRMIAALGTQLLPILTPLIRLYGQMAAQIAGQLVKALIQALPSIIQMVLAFVMLLPTIIPLIPLVAQLALALIPLIPPIVELVAQLVLYLVPILRVVIATFVKIVATILKFVIPMVRLFVSVLSIEFGLVAGYFKILGGVFNVLWGVAKTVFHGIAGAIDSAWTSYIRPTFEAIKSAVGSVGTAFAHGATAIKTAWDKIKGYTKDPVNFVIGTVYNAGIVGMWNKVMGWLHLPKSLELGKMPLLEAGGTLANPVSAGPMITNGPMAIVGEGRSQYPEYVIPTDPRYRGRAQGLWAAAGSNLQMLEGGGILGSVLSGVKKIAGSVLNIGKDAIGLITNPAGVWSRLTAPLLAQSKSVGTSPFGQAVAAVPPKILGEAWTVAKQIISNFAGSFGGGSGDGAKALAFAVAQLGKPYEWGATGPATFDCSGLTMRAWEHAGKNIGRVTGQQIHAGRAGSREQALPGDLHLPETGHVMMFHRPRSGGQDEMIHAPHTGDHVRFAPFRGGGWVRLVATPGGGGASGGFAQDAGAAKNYAKAQLGEFGWGAGQFSPLDNLWNRESNWQWNARNPTSGAYGIPQSLPGGKMASAGADYLTNAITQVRWGLGYIHDRYGTPGGAWAHSLNTGWYDGGGMLQPGLNLAMNATGKPERVLTDSQWAALAGAARGSDGGDHYHVHMDGLTTAQIESQVRTGLQAHEVLAAQRDRTGRPK